MNLARLSTLLLIAILPAALPAAEATATPALAPGAKFELPFPAPDFPPSLFTMMRNSPSTPAVQVQLPNDYSPGRKYPVIVYVPGFDGGTKGNLANAQAVAGQNGWIAVSLPLFKAGIDRSEVSGGMLVSMTDYPTLARAYGAMLGKVFATIPNIEVTRSAMVGFSNGSLTVAVLLSHSDPFILSHFRRFCLVDHGMFHLTDLHHAGARDARYLILVGDQPDEGRELRIRQSKLLQDAWRLLKVDVTAQVLENTGHEFNGKVVAAIRTWLEDGEPAAERAHEPAPTSG